MRKRWRLALLLAAASPSRDRAVQTCLPLDDEAIRYTSGPVNDPVNALQKRMTKAT